MNRKQWAKKVVVSLKKNDPVKRMGNLWKATETRRITGLQVQIRTLDLARNKERQLSYMKRTAIKVWHKIQKSGALVT